MKIAILGDVRANEPALVAVLDEIVRLQVDRVWHVGSLLSYGPDPVAVVDRLRLLEHADRCLVGHPDESSLAAEPLSDFNFSARQSFTWASRELGVRWWSGPTTRARWAWLKGRPSQASDGGLQFFSGTPLYPEADFLPATGFPGRQEQLGPHFAPVRQGAFVGTLGRPGIVFADTLEWQDIKNIEQPMPVGDRRFIACPGSVGQPRDGDPRACFAIWDEQTITWHRVAYDVKETMRRFLAEPQLSENNAHRLALGR